MTLFFDDIAVITDSWSDGQFKIGLPDEPCSSAKLTVRQFTSTTIGFPKGEHFSNCSDFGVGQNHLI